MKEYFLGALAAIILLILFNLFMPNAFQSIILDNLPNSNIIHNVSIKDPTLRKKINAVNTNLNILFSTQRNDFCKNKKVIINMIKENMDFARNIQKSNPEEINGICKIKEPMEDVAFIDESSMDSGVAIQKNNPMMQMLMQTASSNTKQLQLLEMSVIDLMQYTLKTYFCKNGVLSIDNIEKYLLNMVEQICSENNISRVYGDFIKYNIHKPFSLLN